MKEAEESAPTASASSGQEISTSNSRSSPITPRVRPLEIPPASPVSFMIFDSQVLEQVGKLRMAHAVLELGTCIAQAHVLGDGGDEIIHAGGRLNVLGRHEGHAGVHKHAAVSFLGPTVTLRMLNKSAMALPFSSAPERR